MMNRKILLLVADLSKRVLEVKERLRAACGGVACIIVNINESLPAVALLYSCERVFVYTNKEKQGGYADRFCTDFGDLLADYVDNGGRVVLCYCHPMPGGRWQREDYSPISSNSVHDLDSEAFVTLGKNSFLAAETISQIKGPMRINSGEINPASYVDSYWCENNSKRGKPFIPFLAFIKRGKGMVVLLNIYPPADIAEKNGSRPKKNSVLDAPRFSTAFFDAVMISLYTKIPDSLFPSAAMMKKKENPLAWNDSWSEANTFMIENDIATAADTRGYASIAVQDLWIRSGRHSISIRINRINEKGRVWIGFGLASRQFFRKFNSGRAAGWMGRDGNSWGFYYGTQLWHAGRCVDPQYGSRPFEAGDVVTMTVDFTTQELSFSVNGMLYGPCRAFTNIPWQEDLTVVASIRTSGNQLQTLSYSKTGITEENKEKETEPKENEVSRDGKKSDQNGEEEEETDGNLNVKEEDKEISLPTTLNEEQLTRFFEQITFKIIAYEKQTQMRAAFFEIQEQLEQLQRELAGEKEKWSIELERERAVVTKANASIKQLEIQLAEKNEKIEQLESNVVKLQTKADALSGEGLQQMSLERLEQLQKIVESSAQKISDAILNAKLSSDEGLCKVCLDAPKSIVFSPCGHHICCAECAAKVDTCPICRKSIDQKIVLFSL